MKETPEQLWDEAEKVFHPRDLETNLEVKVLTGILLKLFNIKNLKDIKTIDGSILEGKNTLTNLFNIDWGYFDIEIGNKVSLIYRCGTIVDVIRKIKPGLFIGKFYLNGKFMGYFTLTKVD